MALKSEIGKFGDSPKFGGSGAPLIRQQRNDHEGTIRIQLTPHDFTSFSEKNVTMCYFLPPYPRAFVLDRSPVATNDAEIVSARPILPPNRRPRTSGHFPHSMCRFPGI